MIKKEKYSAAILVIGDEILSGRTQDTNSNYIAKEMEMIGINTTQIKVIPDEKNTIIDSVNKNSIRVAKFSQKWRLRPIAFNESNTMIFKRKNL